MEHILLRDIGLNSKNLYSPSYYYHKEKSRYYKYLLNSLERKNLNHFTAFALEAYVLSIISVVKTSLEAKRADFLRARVHNDETKLILKPLVKKHEAQFKNLLKTVKGKMARQTFVTYLQKTEAEGLIKRRVQGRAVYYSINLAAPEEATLRNWLDFVKSRLNYVPNEILLV